MNEHTRNGVEDLQAENERLRGEVEYLRRIAQAYKETAESRAGLLDVKAIGGPRHDNTQIGTVSASSTYTAAGVVPVKNGPSDYERGFADGERAGVAGARRQIAAWIVWAWGEESIAAQVNSRAWGDGFGDGPLPTLTAKQLGTYLDGSSVAWTD